MRFPRLTSVLLAPALSAMLLSPALAGADQPDPAGPPAAILQTSTILAKDVLAAAIEYERRMIDAYNRREDRNKELDARAHRAFEVVIQWLVDAPDARPLPIVGRYPADLIITHKSDDPMMRALDIQLLIARDRTTKRTLELAAGLPEELEKSGYPPHRRAMFYYMLEKLHRQHAMDDEAKRLCTLGSRALVEALAEPGLSALQVRYLAERAVSLLGRLPLDAAEELLTAIRQHPKVSPWVQRICAGRYSIRLAWNARGSGWAHTVTPRGWQDFRRHLAEARQHLQSAWELDPARPEPAAHMITIAMAGATPPGETIWTWFDRATSAQFDYLPAYHKVLWALRPRWGGSHGEMIEFGLRCAATKRYETQVPLQLITALQSISADMAGNNRVWRVPELVKAVEAVVEGSAADPAHEHDKERLYARLAAIAWHAGEFEIGRRALEAAGSRANPAPHFAEMNAPFEFARAELILATSEAAEAYSTARALMAEGKWKEAQAPLRLRGVKVSGPLSAAALHVRALNDFMIEYGKGDWASFHPTPRLAGWNILGGRWQALNRQPVKAKPGEDGLLALMDAPIGSRYEARATIDLSNMIEGWSGNAGLILDYRRDGRAERFLSVRVLGLSNIVRIGREFRAGGLSFPLPPALDPAHPRRHELHVAVWDQHLLVRVNGQLVYTGSQPTLRPSGHGRFGLGGYLRHDNIGEIHFSDLQIRQLAAPPEGMVVAPEIELEELLDLLPPEADEGSGLSS